MSRVISTQESGDSDSLHINRRRRTPKRRPPMNQSRSASTAAKVATARIGNMLWPLSAARAAVTISGG